ncbi:hypothetical protein DL98DRAFT_524410 [Cadophora sp. DSE1049]|nr:hypothetical protein DL98DRAFT_524410 [Cadophora sp. DSE1049]
MKKAEIAAENLSLHFATLNRARRLGECKPGAAYDPQLPGFYRPAEYIATASNDYPSLTIRPAICRRRRTADPAKIFWPISAQVPSEIRTRTEKKQAFVEEWQQLVHGSAGFNKTMDLMILGGCCCGEGWSELDRSSLYSSPASTTFTEEIAERIFLLTFFHFFFELQPSRLPTLQR